MDRDEWSSLEVMNRLMRRISSRTPCHPSQLTLAVPRPEWMDVLEANLRETGDLMPFPSPAKPSYCCWGENGRPAEQLFLYKDTKC
jgi:hypothetical protein